MTEPDPQFGHVAMGGRAGSWIRGHATAVICLLAVFVVAVAFAVTRLSSAPSLPLSWSRCAT